MFVFPPSQEYRGSTLELKLTCSNLGLGLFPRLQLLEQELGIGAVRDPSVPRRKEAGRLSGRSPPGAEVTEAESCGSVDCRIRGYSGSRARPCIPGHSSAVPGTPPGARTRRP